MPGKAPRQKGDRFERECVHRFNAAGIRIKRVPLSGSAGGDHTDDLEGQVLGQDVRLECKARKRAWSDLFGWLSRSDRAPPDVLVIKADRTDTLVVMTLDRFCRLVQPEPWSVD